MARVGVARTEKAVATEVRNDGNRRSLPSVMTVKELSLYLRVHPSTIYKLLRRGDLPGFRIGADWRFSTEAIDRWCSERRMRRFEGQDTSS
jgi:excisionase family DNA binding protein